MNIPLNLETFAEIDAADPLGHIRAQFQIPGHGVYFNGNSLGPRPLSSGQAIIDCLQNQWGNKGGAAWKYENWMALPFTVGNKIAQVIGADQGEVVVADSTSINLAKMLRAGLSLTPGRRVILTDRQNFPTDRYILDEFLKHRPDLTLRVAEEDALLDAMTDEVALITLTHVNFRTGRRHDMIRINARAREKGILTLWDLSHSAGAVNVDINAHHADLAIGCTYKYLNGGPGAPAYIYVAKRHQNAICPGLPGWMGHAQPFDFAQDYTAGDGMARHLTGTPPILALTVLDKSLDIALSASVDKTVQKTEKLVEIFKRLVVQELSGTDISILNNESGALHGAQVSLQSQFAGDLVDMLGQEGLILDYRPPNIMRFGLAGLYVRYSDLWHAVAALKRLYPH